MTDAPSTIRVVIPLKLKHRNGRPRIVPPDNIDTVEPDAQEPHLVRAIARAWNWRRMLERGEVTTLKDVADTERVTVPFVSRFIRLAYLSPAVLERLLIHRSASALSIDKLAVTALAPWADQLKLACDE